MSAKAKVLIILGSVTLIALGVTVYVFAENFFKGKFPEQTTVVENTDVSDKTVDEALASMNAAEGLHMTVTKDDVAYTVDISNSVKRQFDSEQVSEAKSDISFFSYLFHTKVSKAVTPKSVEINVKDLTETIERALPDSKYSTTDAYFDSDWNLIGEVQGDDIDFDKFMERVKSDIAKGAEMEYNAADFYHHPKVKASDENMQKTLKKVKKYKSMTVTIDMTCGHKEVLTSENICSQLVMKKGKLKFKKDWDEKYIKELANRYDTYGKKRKFKSTKDGNILVPPGNIGWQINQSESLDRLQKALKKMKSSKMKMAYINKGAAFGKNNDIGDTYVEVSINRQHVWVYKKGKMVLETDCVTGVPNKERMTHPGVYKIYAKQKDRWLGTMAVQGYHTHVDYFMPFHGGEGLHDAPWRAAFGGRIFVSNGSHGCVNLPPAKVAKIYDLVSVGTPVVVYDTQNTIVASTEEKKKTEKPKTEQKKKTDDNKKKKTDEKPKKNND
ncbi:MAG: L,D-transpeptidase/peptidoglycan binding protein [Eubacterium sp.]|nr:L,D-transpeptidase/peptidoglycan binding protein [Eubacterium sp.]